MKIRNHLLVACFGITFSFAGWADYAGTYDCEWADNGQNKTSQITTVKKDDSYEFTIHEDGKAVAHDELIKTSNPNVFLNGWKSDNHAGISTWTFTDDSLKLDTKKRKINLEEVENVINCKLHK